MLKYKLYLDDILKAIAQIEKSLNSKTREYFEKDVDVAEATAMRLQIIGESIHKLPEKLKEKHGEINWDNFVRFRNIISHAYFKVNREMLWDTSRNDLAELKKIVGRMKNEK